MVFPKNWRVSGRATNPTVARPFSLVVVLTAAIAANGTDATQPSWPSPDWPNGTPAEVHLRETKLLEARQYAQSAGGSGMIVRHGKAVLRWGNQHQRYDIKSATKSFGATMLGVAVQDKKIELDAPAKQYHPHFGVPPQENLKTGWLGDVTILQLATQTAGFAKPGGYEKLLFKPGSHWLYSDGGPNWLAECLTLIYQRDLQEVMFERVFSPLGISRQDLHWRNNQYRDHQLEGIPRREFGAGIHANTEALARLGYLYLREGRWRDQQILPKTFVRMAMQPLPAVMGLPEWEPANHHNASENYGLLWWNNADASLAGVPRDAAWAWGLYDSLIVVIPSLDLVVVRAGERGRQWPRSQGVHHYHVLEPFLRPIVEAVSTSTLEDGLPVTEMHRAPYPASTLITGIEWAPSESIVRLARGSDNWPMTWAEDDLLVTAFGDGWGFEPKLKQKLSLGLATVAGNPPNIQGHNLRSDAERLGQGADGEKASGMLMVDGVLYMLVRNANNSQLAWSEDHGTTWQRAGWKWTTSFGCPTFLNFGRNYAGRPQFLHDFVYIYSHDSDSAYQPADRMVLARVPKNRIRSREAYEFFQQVDPASGRAIWSKDIEQRGAVFFHPGNCYRSGITYNSGLKRFLWCQTLPGSDDSRGPRFQGGFGIYESSRPWGPWETVYFTRNWDVGPGETGRFPTKWMSDDGKTVHYAFSGNDYFSVRKAMLVVPNR